MPAQLLTYDDLAAAALRELARRRASETPTRRPSSMNLDDHESRLDALQRQVTRMEHQQLILLDILNQLRVEVEALTQALRKQGRQGGSSVWPPR